MKQKRLRPTPSDRVNYREFSRIAAAVIEDASRPEGAPLRIGLYSPALPDSGVSNGIVTYTRIMRDALRALGHSVVIATTEGLEHADGAVDALRTDNVLVGRARELIEARRPDDGSHPLVRLRILDAFRAARDAGAQIFEIEESFGWAARMAGKGLAIVERLHGPHVFVRDEFEAIELKRVGDLRQAAEHQAFSKIDAVTAPSQTLLDAMRPYGLDNAIARAIPNPMPVATHRDLWSIERANPDQILFVGRFDSCKGADIAIQAFADALARRPTLELVMAGPNNGLVETDGRKVRFEEFVTREVSPLVRGRIRFLGERSADQIAELRLESGLALIASRFETSSYALAEAMAIGMPVLASNCFGPAEIVQDRISGLIVPISDVQATSQAIVQLAGDRALLSTIGQGAYARVDHWLSPERVARATVDVYREAIARSRTG